MTNLLSKAFAEVKHVARRAHAGRRHNAGIVLLIDEADALAQSRELAQMHHEDRAGVNALIRGIDDLQKCKSWGASCVLVASALHDGRLTIAELCLL